MSENPRIVVAGGSGRMGQMLVQTITASDRATLSAVTERPGHDWVGTDIGTATGGQPLGVQVTDNLNKALDDADILIDFTTPDSTVSFACETSKRGIVHVIGTTGFDGGHLSEIAKAAQGAVIVRAGNMSLGVNLLLGLTKQVAAALDDDFDIEIIEMHHHHKVDAPSGTALMLGEAAAEGRGVSLAEAADRGRDGITGARQKGTIGFAALRGGDVVGEHDVIFAAPGERIVIRHLASDRQIFARGALKAALWAFGKPFGEYNMEDVLGLK